MSTILILISIFILGILFWTLSTPGEPSKDKDDEKVQDETFQEQLLRRRSADKEIEERFADIEERRYRRKTDTIQPVEGIDTVNGDFSLPYLVDEIIPDKSRFKIYKRTLANSEIYARKGDFLTSISPSRCSLL